MASTYEPITTQTLASAAASVTFSSISSTYTDLILVANAKVSTAADVQECYLQFNSDTATNYSLTRLYGTGSSALSGRETNITKIDNIRLPGSNSASTVFGNMIANINNYSNTTTYKNVLLRMNAETTNGQLGTVVGLWRSTSAISTILFAPTSGNFVAGSTFTLYGIKAA